MQPPGIRHTVVGWSDDCELLEIGRFRDAQPNGAQALGMTAAYVHPTFPRFTAQVTRAEADRCAVDA